MSTDSDFARLDFDVSVLPEFDKRKTDANMELIRQIFVEVREIRKEQQVYREYITRAFPDDDPDGHRSAHEAWIKKADASAKFWTDLRASVVKWGLFGILGFATVATWRAFLEGPK